MKAPLFWQERSWKAQVLKPLSYLYGWCAKQDKIKKMAQQQKLPRPVVVVGNINVGGTGKTPVTIALIEGLQALNYKVGLISRGYGRLSNDTIVSYDGVTVGELGDEPYLIHQKTGVPTAVSGSRYDAGMALLDHYPEIDIVISDDGLQHYALHRDFEIVVMGKQGVGNGYLLPAGPLRESTARLQSVDAIVALQKHECFDEYLNKYFPIEQSIGLPYLIDNSNIKREYSQFNKVSAVAGIAHPDNFFCALMTKNVKIVKYPFGDHHQFTLQDFINMAEPILMTEKDAVKCHHLLKDRDAWAVPLETRLSSKLIPEMITKIYSKADE